MIHYTDTYIPVFTNDTLQTFFLVLKVSAASTDQVKYAIKSNENIGIYVLNY